MSRDTAPVAPGHDLLDVLDLLGPVEDKVLAAVVLGDGHLDRAGLAVIAGLSPAATADALDLLAHVGLVRCVPPGAVIVAHAHLRRAVLDRLDTDRRRRLHAALAEVLAATAASPALVSSHAEAAGEARLAPRGIGAAAVACREALRVGEVEAALGLLERIERLVAVLPASA